MKIRSIKFLPLTARFPFSETSNLLVAGMRRTSNCTEPDRWNKQRKTEEGHAHYEQYKEVKQESFPQILVSIMFHPLTPPLFLRCSHLFWAGWWPCEWWHLQKSLVWFPWQHPDSSPKCATLLPSSPLQGRGLGHRCSVQSDNGLQTLGQCLLLIRKKKHEGHQLTLSKKFIFPYMLRKTAF